MPKSERPERTPEREMYRLTRSSHGRLEGGKLVRYRGRVTRGSTVVYHGDLIELTDEERQAHDLKDRTESIRDPIPEPEDEIDLKSLIKGPATKVITFIKGCGRDDLIMSILELEGSQPKPRKTVVEACEKALATEK